MDSGGKEGSSYLDGVPVKISSKFIPPRPVPLPYTYDDKLNYNILDEVYNFTLEKSVIDHHSNRLIELKKAKTKPPPSKESPAENHSNPSCSSAQWSTDSILQPQQPPPSEDTPRDNKVMKINLSDFENDTSSPFDYMELQTINDIEELSSVFQGIHAQELPVENNNAPEITSNVSKSKSFPLPESHAGTDLGHGSLPASSYEIPLLTDSYLTLSQVPYISATGAQVARAPSLLRVSKSYSDISSLGKAEEIRVERSRTPPSTFSYAVSSEECRGASSNGDCDDYPDPYYELEEGARDFVDSITEMGFARPQVSRTVKHLGTDEKKVVEHLCQIQSLEESGYEGLEAEAALHLHNYNREEAKVYLDLVIQFQDLGFEKKAVMKALVQNKNDYNKTIDALLT